MTKVTNIIKTSKYTVLIIIPPMGSPTKVGQEPKKMVLLKVTDNYLYYTIFYNQNQKLKGEILNDI